MIPNLSSYDPLHPVHLTSSLCILAGPVVHLNFEPFRRLHAHVYCSQFIAEFVVCNQVRGKLVPRPPTFILGPPNEAGKPGNEAKCVVG